MPLTNKSIIQLSTETGVSEHTLYARKRVVKSAGIAAPARIYTHVINTADACKSQ